MVHLGVKAVSLSKGSKSPWAEGQARYWRRDRTLASAFQPSYPPSYQAAFLWVHCSGLELLGEASVVR